MASCFFGSGPHAMAVLALAAGDHAAARTYAAAAVAMHDRPGWPRWAELRREVLRKAAS